jgi:7,8-dihydropterin-6-yl-methyl-4-(beta-D-ribofuranosyl)aminobenzene 5'-phosphate synthase
MGQLDALEITVLAEDSVPYESRLSGQHGISYLVEAFKNGHKVNVLVDVGQNPQGLLHNMEQLKVDPASIDMVVLTHCHYDHTKGLAAVLSRIGKDNVPVVAHPSLFRLNFVTRPYLMHVGVMNGDQPDEVVKNGGRLFLVSEPLELMEGLITSGEIERTTDFEEVGIPLYTLANGRIEADQMKDDLALIANVAGKGLVIVSGCSHAGIVNICRQAIKLTGVEKIEGILGGFHLVGSGPERISKTASALEDLRPAWIAAGHCTGFEAEVVLKNVLNDRFHHLSSGNVYTV